MIPGQMGSKGCEKLEPVLEDYLHGELPRADAERLAVHLEACGDCREALEDLRVSVRLVSGAFEQSADPGLGFARLVMARINTAEQWLQGQRAFWRPFEAVAWRLAFSAAVALVFLFAYGMRTSTETATTPVTSISSQQDVFTVPVSATPSTSDEVLMAIAEKHHDR